MCSIKTRKEKKKEKSKTVTKRKVTKIVDINSTILINHFKYKWFKYIN